MAKRVRRIIVDNMSHSNNISFNMLKLVWFFIFVIKCCVKVASHASSAYPQDLVAYMVAISVDSEWNQSI